VVQQTLRTLNVPPDLDVRPTLVASQGAPVVAVEESF
jgi:hypothetical protein